MFKNNWGGLIDYLYITFKFQMFIENNQTIQSLWNLKNRQKRILKKMCAYWIKDSNVKLVLILKIPINN